MMIKNERQYRITKAQAAQFERTLAEFDESAKRSSDVHPQLIAVQKNAIEAQLNELRAQLQEYEALRSGTYVLPKLTAVELLPELLIKARIAAGLTQRDLAERLGLKEQQIQRYEATGYASASLARIHEVVRALDLRDVEDLLPASEVRLTTILKNLRKIGLESDFVLERLLPYSVRVQLGSSRGAIEDSLGAVLPKLGEVLRRVFSWTLHDIVESRSLAIDQSGAAAAGFKVPAGIDEKRMKIYAVYTRYLVRLMVEATRHLPQRPLPTSAAQLHEEVMRAYGSITFDSLLNYVWGLGISVLPLRDSGAFHGACWRTDGRTVIVLKQKTRSNSRWLFDLCHECRHAVQVAGFRDGAIIEPGEIALSSRGSQEEQDANRFAGDVVLGGRAEELTDLSVDAAGGSVERLKTAVQQVARKESIPVDSLANYLAFRLSLQGINWWGAATNLQTTDSDPWVTARDMCLRNMDLNRLEQLDADLLASALAGNGG